MIVDAFRWFRNSVAGLNATNARFDVVQSKLDAIASGVARLGDAESTGKDELDSLQVAAPTGPLACESAAGACIAPEEVVRLAFVVQHPSVWPSLRSVWAAASRDPRIIAKLVLTPFRHPFSSQAVVYDDLRRCLMDEGAPFCTADYFDVKVFRPDVVFIQNPYEETRPEHLRIERLKEAGARIAYVPYGLEIGGGAWNVMAQFDTALHRSAWRIFARSPRHRKMFGKYCRAGNDHVVVTGHPKFDTPRSVGNNRLLDRLQGKIAGRKVILWTPHFSVGNPPTWSTYRLYSEFIFAEMARRQDVFLLVRPHPLFYKAMDQNQVWGEGGAAVFRQTVGGSGNMALDEAPDYHEAFAVSDALMTDVGSFLLEYLPVAKPLLYLHHPEGLGMNDDGALVQNLYVASGNSEIADFVEMVSRGEDPKKAVRQSAVPDFLHGLGSNIGETICRHVYSAVRAGNDGAPSPCGEASEHGNSARRFWQGATAIENVSMGFNEKKEAAIRDVLDKLPPSRKAIDLGCGDGRFTVPLSAKAGEVCGYDISPALVDMARELATVNKLVNVSFLVQEIEALTPFEKYDLIACLDVTRSIVDDMPFLDFLDRLALLSRDGAHLLLSDTLSFSQEHMAFPENACVAKHRCISDYLRLVEKRGFVLSQEKTIEEDIDAGVVNKLFLFEFRGLGLCGAHGFSSDGVC